MTMPAPSFQDLTAALQGLGWNLDGVDPPSKQTPKYVATATGPDGVKKKVCDGPSPEFALGNLVAFAQRHNQIRAYAATHKVAGWDLPWENQMEEIGKAYGELPVFDPKAVPHWQALAQESKHQADAIRKQLQVNVTDDPEPYPHVGAMIHDIHHKGKFTVSRAHSDHPVWSVPDNVNFRIVHDVLGHGQTGGDFGWNGEQKACGIHFPMLSKMARPALFTECVGQTAYALRKGSHGFGQQKIGVLPQFLDPVEKMNGEHVYIPHGKFAYPEEIDGGGGAAAWGWYKDPQTGIWKQDENAGDTSEHVSGVRERIVVADVASDLSDPETGDKLWDDNHAMFQGRDPNHDYVTPADVTQQAGMTGHPDFNGDQVKAGTPSDWLDRTGTYRNTAKMVVPWWERGSDGAWKYPVKEQERIIMNAFRLCMLSPLKNLKWNFAHYQGIMNMPVNATGREMWDVLDNTRRQHNKARGFDEDEHLSYYKEIKVLAGYITYETGKHKSEALKDAKQQVYEKVSEFERQLTAQHEQGTLKLESTPGEWSGEDDDTDEEGITPLRIYLTAHQMVDEWLRGLLASRSPQSEADRPEHEQLALASLRKEAAGLGMDDEMRGLEKLEQGRNMFGPLGPEQKERMLRFLNDPSAANWDDIRGMIVGADGWTTVWQAVLKYENNGRVPLTADPNAIPDPQTVIRGMETVIPDAQPTPDTFPSEWHTGAKTPRPGDTSFEGETFGGKEKYAGFMGGHLDNISKIAPVLPEIRAAALKDIYTDGGRGFIFRNAMLNLKSQYKLTGINPKVISFIWLLMYPEGSDLGIVDTHVARAFQRNYKDVGSIKDYYKLERMQKAVKDSTGYPDMPLGTFHHGMWDVVRSKDWRKGVTHSDHSPGAIDQPEPWDQHEYDMDTGNAKMGTWVGPTAFEQARPLAENVGARYEAQYQGQAKNRIPYSVLEDMGQRAATFDPNLFTPDVPSFLKPLAWWVQGQIAQGGWGDGNTTMNISAWITAFWQAMGILKKHNDKVRATELLVSKGVPREVAPQVVEKLEEQLGSRSVLYPPYSAPMEHANQMPDKEPALTQMPQGEQIDKAAGWVLAADEVVPNGGDLPFKPGDRVQIGGTGKGEYGTVIEVEPRPEDYVPEECEMCGAPTEDNLDEEGLCRGCFSRPHEYDPTVWLTVKLDSGKSVHVADSHVRFIQGMEPVPARPPATQQTHPGPDSPQAIDDMLRNAGWIPQDPNSPHGGYANTGDVVCNHCGKRTPSQRECENCEQPLDGTEQPIIAGNYDPENPAMKESSPQINFGDGSQAGDHGLDDDSFEDFVGDRAGVGRADLSTVPTDETDRLKAEWESRTAATDPDYTFVFYQGGLVVEPCSGHPNVKDMAARLLKDFGFPSMTDHDNGPGTDDMRLWSAGDVWGDGDHIQITQLSDPDVADDARQAVRAYFDSDHDEDGHAVVVTQDDGEWEVQEPKTSTQQDPAVEEALEWEMEPEAEVEDWELA